MNPLIETKSFRLKFPWSCWKGCGRYGAVGFVRIGALPKQNSPLSLGFFAFVHNVRQRGKVLLPARIALLVTSDPGIHYARQAKELGQLAVTDRSTACVGGTRLRGRACRPNWG